MTSPAAAPDIRIDVLLDDDAHGSLAEEVRAGLLVRPKELPPRCLYDERGSDLFDRITELPEYYPARCERAILNRYAPDIVARVRAEELLELGSGVASKTRALLYAMAGAGTLRRYVPFDVDVSVVERSAEELTALYPGLSVHGLVGDFGRHLGDLPDPAGRRLVAFLGGTIGNLHPPERAEMLAALRPLLRSGDRLLLGADLVKDERTLIAAYDDLQGVTAAFTANVLHVLNRELDADFDLEAFEPFARWDAEAERMELGLRSLREQRVRLDALGPLEVDFEAAEELLTEISSKFTPAGLELELAQAGLRLERLLYDEEGLFSVALVAPDLQAVASGDGRTPR
jgi:L-histidine N-alpha-methyltransferase